MAFGTLETLSVTHIILLPTIIELSTVLLKCLLHLQIHVLGFKL